MTTPLTFNNDTKGAAAELVTLRLADELDLLRDYTQRHCENTPTFAAQIMQALACAIAATFDSLEDFSQQLIATEAD